MCGNKKDVKIIYVYQTVCSNNKIITNIGVSRVAIGTNVLKELGVGSPSLGNLLQCRKNTRVKLWSCQTSSSLWECLQFKS